MRFVAVMVSVGALALSGCGAGRSAAWEKSGAAKPAASAESFDELVREGEEAWATRGERASLEKAIAAWEKALAAKEDPKALAKLSRAYYFLADGYMGKGDEQLKTYEKGVKAAERGIAAASPRFKQEVTGGVKVEEAMKNVGAEGVESMYWYASNLGKWARAQGIAKTLGNKDRIRAAMDRCLDLDPNYFYAGPHRYFGAFYAVAPGFAGGDLNKSKDHYDKSLALAPDYLGTKVLYADTYATKKEDRALFEKLLDEVIAADPNKIPEIAPEMKIEQEKAKQLKAKASELF